MTNADEPDVVSVRVGIIDGPLRTRPSSHYYVGQMANWWRIDDQLLRFETEIAPTPSVLGSRRPAHNARDVAIRRGPACSIWLNSSSASHRCFPD